MKRAFLLGVLILSLRCADPVETAVRSDERAAVSLGPLSEVSSPAAPGSGEPHLAATPGGRLLMSWTERREGDLAAVRVSGFDGAAWSEPSIIAEREDLFVNWADFPSVHALDESSLAAHWLQKSGEGVYAYDVRIARSTDGGRTWSEGVTPHRDGTESEHGFVSLGHRPGSSDLEAIWLDGRAMGAASQSGHGHGEGEMSMRWARIGVDGSILEEAVLDERTCECCQTSMAMTSAGPLVVYRDRSAEEQRDVAFVRQTPAGWTLPSLAHDDGWKIEGCPVNGPQVDALGEAAVVAWFSGAGGKGSVSAAFSPDAGASWSAPIAIDAGDPVGRVDVVLIAGDAAVVTWVERAESGAEVLTRIVRADGTVEEPRRVGTSSPARAAGFPRTAVAGDRVYYAWTEPAEPARIRLSHAKIDR